jgi:hypothetical protein
MEVIKKRISVIDFFLTGGAHALYLPTIVESVGLQMRKVMELIAFGSMVANKDTYSVAHEHFAKHWNARLLLRGLEPHRRKLISWPAPKNGFGDRITLQEASAATSLRADILARVLPRTPIAERCRLEELLLEVQGQLGRYHISLVWGLSRHWSPTLVCAG